MAAFEKKAELYHKFSMLNYGRKKFHDSRIICLRDHFNKFEKCRFEQNAFKDKPIELGA